MRKLPMPSFIAVMALAAALVPLGTESLATQTAQPRPAPATPPAPPAPSQQSPAGRSQPGQEPPGAVSQGQQPPSAPDQKKPPRAKSQEELDAYQKFMREQNPDEQIKLIEDFLLNYPNTELKEYAYQAATQAYQAKNDYARVLTYGELTLTENENNLVALLVLASAIPERTEKNDIDKETKLAQAEQYAKRGLEALAKLPMPPNLTEGQWAQVKKDAESTPHAALGMISLIREDFPKAEAEFKMSSEMAARPDPITFYRLGLCYSFEKKYAPALEALEKAALSGGVKVQAPDGSPRDLVAEARDFVVKAKTASESPVSGAVVAPGPAPVSNPGGNPGSARP
jgi:hypothetical protein